MKIKFIQAILTVLLFVTCAKAQNCKDLEYWADMLKKEFPNVNIGDVRSGSEMCKRIWYCLYSDKFFIEFAGNPYDELSESGRMRRWKKVRECNKKQNYSGDPHMSWLHTFGLNPLSIQWIADEVKLKIAEQRGLRAEYNAILKSLAAGNEGFDNFTVYEKKLLGALAFLSPAEIDVLSETMKGKKIQAASRELVVRAEKTKSLGNTPVTLKHLLEFKYNNADAYDLADNSSRRRAAAVVEEKMESVVHMMTLDERNMLKGIPLTPEGLALLEKFSSEFNQRYNMFQHQADVKETEAAMVTVKTQIINQLSPDIRASVMKAAKTADLDLIEKKYLRQVNQTDTGIVSLAGFFNTRRSELRETEQLAAKQMKELEKRKADEFNNHAAMRRSLSEQNTESFISIRKALESKNDLKLPWVEDLSDIVSKFVSINDDGRYTKTDGEWFIYAAESLGYMRQFETIGRFSSFKNSQGYSIETASLGNGQMFYISLVIPKAPREIIELYVKEITTKYRKNTSPVYEPWAPGTEIPAASGAYVINSDKYCSWHILDDKLSVRVTYSIKDIMIAERIKYNTVKITPVTTETDIQLEAGNVITFKASGYLKLGFASAALGFGSNGCTPAGVAVNRPRTDQRYMCGALIGRVGNGDWFYIGESSTITVKNTGALILKMNISDFVAGDYFVEYSIQ